MPPAASPARRSASPALTRRTTSRSTAGTAPARLGVNDGFGTVADGAWLSSPLPPKAKAKGERLSHAQAPPVLLTGRRLGLVVSSLLSLTTTLYLNHDRQAKEWDQGVTDVTAQGYWPAPSGDFNWCEPDYVYTPLIMEMWNSITSLCFCVGPALLWGSTRDFEVRFNLMLVIGIGLGSFIFHATLQYEGQLLDELPMFCYVMHTVALLSRPDGSCPAVLKLGMLLLSSLLFGTDRDALAHKAGRVVMVLGFSGCFVWLAFSLAAICAQLDTRDGGNGFFYTRRYQYASLTVTLAIVAWVTDNLTCRALHQLPLGLPYPQLHAAVWHTGMAYVCHCLCLAVRGKHEQFVARKQRR